VSTHRAKRIADVAMGHLRRLAGRPDLYKEMNEAYAEFFPKAKRARAMVRFGANIPGVLVATEAIALT
jgi:enamine deaminase RidA (YjgF/YER057c/UK114 family)